MNRIKIILAEDHIVVREGLRELLQQEQDIEVIGEASNGEEVVEMVNKLNPDLVLMDIAMPEMNGIEATKKIKISHPHINVLVLTAYDNEEFIFAIIEAKAAGYLLKNVKGTELLNAIRAVDRGESFLHPTITKKVLKRLQTQKQNHITKKRQFLSRRELEVVKLGAEGLASKEIAYKLSLSERTVQSHWRHIFIKLGVSSRIEAIMACLNKEWININQKEISY